MAIDDAAWQDFCGIFAGDKEAIHEIVGIFLEESAELADALKTAALAENADGIRRAAHSLKSTSRQLGALKLGELSQEFEAAGRAGDTKEPNRRLHDFISEVASVREALQRKLDG